jgi:hypothetical protein
MSFNLRRLKIVLLLLLGNLSPSTIRYWGVVGVRTAIKASSGWGPWIQ